MSKNSDIIISCCALLLSLVAGLLAYQFILKEGDKSTFLFSQLPEKDRAFNIYSNNDCIGQLNYSFVKEGTIGLVATGAINLVSNEKPRTTKFVTELTFNQLNQLATTETRIVSTFSDIYVGSGSVNPIKFELSGHLNEIEHNKQFNLLGPVTIHENKDGSYALKNRRLAGSLGNHVNSFINYLIGDLDIQLKDTDEKDFCTAEKHLDTSKTFEKLQQLSDLGTAFMSTLEGT